MSKTTAGQMLIYNGGLVPQQQGAGFFGDLLKSAKNAHDFVKKHKLLSKGAAIASAVGADKYLDAKTGNKYSKVLKYGKSKGYGKNKRKTKKH